MNTAEFLQESFGVSQEILNLTAEAEKEVADTFRHIAETAEFNQYKVQKAFYDNRVSETHLLPTTGYGYDDIGRDTLDKVYAQVFEAEDALVRHHFVNGSHTIATALYAVLRPGDVLFAVTGKPYDTLEEAIGISGEPGRGSLKDYGIEYCEAELKENGLPDFEKIKEVLTSKKIKAVEIQRSKGYGWRPTYSAEYIGEIVKFVKNISPETICIVDNCYGEFADLHEPTYYGADLIVGSLIKNPGGGLALTGGYIAGRHDLIELCSYRLTCVGIGKECGASIGMNRNMYQGFFMAPHITAQAIKSAVLCSALFKKLGAKVDPEPDEVRHDIIQSIRFENPDKVIAFCQGIQKGSPVDSFVTPEPWDMPGYQDQVIMAAGAFVQGASIELSADAPMKPPYIVYMQGGLTYESAKLGIMIAAENMKKLDK